MSIQSIENPAPIYNTSIFIPKLWSNTTKNTTNIITTTGTTDFIGDISLYTGTALPSNKFLWCDGEDFGENIYPELAVILKNYKKLSPTPGGSSFNSGSSSNSFSFNILGSSTSPLRTETIASINGVSGYKGGTWTITTSINYTVTGSYVKSTSASGSIRIIANFPIGFKLYTGTGTLIKTLPFTTTTSSANLTNVGFNVVNNGGAGSSIFYSASQFVSGYTITCDLAYGSTGNYNIKAEYLETFTAIPTSAGFTSLSCSSSTSINTNTYTNSFSITSGTGTITPITTIPNTLLTPSITYTPVLLPYTPDFRNRNIINYTSSCYTTNTVPQVTYDATCTSVSGNRTMTLSQLETHAHGYNISPTVSAVTGVNSNTAPRTFNAFVSRANLLDSVGTTSGANLTQGTISTIPSSQTDLYSPFVVVNYIIRALL